MSDLSWTRLLEEKDKEIEALEAILTKVKKEAKMISDVLDRIEALEDVISSGFQELSGRDVADALIANANMRDRIAALEKKIRELEGKLKTVGELESVSWADVAMHGGSRWVKSAWIDAILDAE
jgi:hypothetical protein